MGTGLEARCECNIKPKKCSICYVGFVANLQFLYLPTKMKKCPCFSGNALYPKLACFTKTPKESKGRPLSYFLFFILVVSARGDYEEALKLCEHALR